MQTFFPAYFSHFELGSISITVPHSLYGVTANLIGKEYVLAVAIFDNGSEDSGAARLIHKKSIVLRNDLTEDNFK